MIVVDASVAAKWYLPEPDSDKAVALLDGPDALAAPDLIRLEVLGTISRRHRERGLSTAMADRSMELWLDHLDAGRIELAPLALDLTAARRLSLSIRHSFFDCLYLAAAMRLGAVLVTADAALCVRGRTVYPAVEAL
jgi:predicted nucleic acid-binding protein